MRKSPCFVAFFAAALLTPSAYAASLGTADVSGLSVSFQDLAAGDGISPSLTITGASTYVRGSAIVSSSTDDLNAEVTRRRLTLGAIAADAPVPSGFAASSGTSFAGGQTGSLHSAGFAGEINGTSRATGQVIYDFLLSPQTSMTVKGTMSANVMSFGVPVGTNGQFAAGQIIMLFTSQQSNLDTVFSINVSATPVAPNYDLIQSSESKPFQYTFTNTTNQPFVGHVSAYTDVYVQNAAAPVPELPSLAMMLAGLGVVGFLGSRRRRIG